MDVVLVVGEAQKAKALTEQLGLLRIEAIPCAPDWKLAVRSLTSNQVSLVLLDVDGQAETMEFFRALRDLTELPIVARGVTSRHDQMIWYLDNGAADYLARNVKPTILVAKIQSLLRTLQPPRQAKGVINVGDVTIDLDGYLILKGGVPVSLTPIEFRLLGVLAENLGRGCSRKKLLNSVWGEDFQDCWHYLRLYMAYLRNKLEDDPRRPEMLLTDWGYGYRLVEAGPKTAPAPAKIRRSWKVVAG